ncbi:unnamed protein product [Prunus armeniaca]
MTIPSPFPLSIPAPIPKPIIVNRFREILVPVPGWHFKPKNCKNQPTIYRNETAIAVNRTAFALLQIAKYSRTDDEVEFYKEMEHMTTYNIDAQTTQRGSSNPLATNT